SGEVLRPALIWCDQRTQPECDWLEAKIGRARLIEFTSNPALPNFTLTKLLWVRTHQPELFGRIAHVLCPKDYVRYMLTGDFGMGIVSSGSVSATIGTSGVVFASTDKPALDPQGRLHTFCHAAPGLWHVMGVTNGAGLSLRWFRDTFAKGTDYDTLASEAS